MGYSGGIGAALDFPEAVGGLILLSGFYRPTLRADVPLFSVSAIPVFGDLVRYTIAPPLTEAIMPRLIERCFAPIPVPEPPCWTADRDCRHGSPPRPTGANEGRARPPPARRGEHQWYAAVFHRTGPTGSPPKLAEFGVEAVFHREASR